jgi:hypothetical protein
MPTLFSTNSLMMVVQSLVGRPQWFLNRYFQIEQTETSEEIHFDLIDKTRRLAPFVSPVVAGQVVQSQGYETKTLKPAYVKDKRVFNAQRPLKRMAGERIGGELSPAQRMQALLGMELLDQVELVERRLEVMAAQVLRTGSIIIKGDQYPETNVNFGRKSSLTVTLTGSNKWGQAGGKPLENLQDWALTMLQASGAMATDVVMDVNAWKVFKSDPDVQKRLELMRGNSTMVQNAQIEEGGVYMGNIDGFNIFVYSGWYIDPEDATNTEVPILPAGTVLLLTSEIMGVRAFGAIQDVTAGNAAVPYYSTSKIEFDPSAIILLMQSAPLIVPTRVNASFSATVL